MSEFNQNELTHYGVPGMRWGVRRASKQLSRATTQKQYNKAVKRLDKHRVKSERELKALSKSRPGLDSRLSTASKKDNVKAAKYATKAAKQYKKENRQRRKSRNILNSKEARLNAASKAEKYRSKGDVLQAKADKYKSNYEYAKGRVEKNERMQKAFKQGIKDIDAAIVEQGKRYMSLPETKPKKKKK